MADWRYWAVDIPGLTEEQADAILQWVSREYGLSGSTVDPNLWFTSHIDDSTVRALADATARSPSDDVVATGMREDFQEWLNATQAPGDRE